MARDCKANQWPRDVRRLDDAARQIAEFVADPGELVAQSCRCWSCRRQSALDRFLVMLDHIIDLCERACLLDLGAKARWTGAGIALEHGDRGMLVLNLARHGAERPVGDVPGERPSKLTGSEPPWATLDTDPSGERASRWSRRPLMRWITPPRSTVMLPLFIANVCQIVSAPRVSRCCTERRSTTSIARATGAMVTHSASSPLISRAL